MRGLCRGLSLAALLGLLWIQGCGDATFFFFWNTGNVGGVPASGAVLIIGTPREDPPESVRLISGEIPPGMKLMEDTTVRGVPEATGTFLMDVEVIERTGGREVLHYEVEIE